MITRVITKNTPFQVNARYIGLAITETPVNATLSYSVTGDTWTDYEDVITDSDNAISHIPRYIYLKLNQDCIVTEE